MSSNSPEYTAALAALNDSLANGLVSDDVAEAYKRAHEAESLRYGKMNVILFKDGSLFRLTGEKRTPRAGEWYYSETVGSIAALRATESHPDGDRYILTPYE